MDSVFNLDNSFFSCSSSEDFFSADSDDSTAGISLCDQLTHIFSKFPKNLNFVHINAQSVPFHYSDILASFDSNIIHGILISESFLKPSLPSTQYSLPGFILIRNDRIGKGCGGVAIYLRADLQFSIISQSPSNYSNSAEHLFIEVFYHHTKFLLGVYYSPSLRVDYFSSFQTQLENLCPLYEHVIILGDFNTCLMKNDSRSNKLLNLTSSMNINILPLAATHHAPNFQPSLIDLILVSNRDFVASHGQLTSPFSYHDLIYLSYKLRAPKRTSKYLLLRSYKGVDLAALRKDATKIDWTPIFTCDDIDQKVDLFNSIIAELYNVHAPLRKIRVKHLPAPWLTQDIKEIMIKRDRVKMKYKKHRSVELLDRYKALRNRCNRMCRDAKRRHIHESIEKYDSAQVWKFLKSLGIGKKQQSCSPNLDFNALNKHFSSSPITIADNIKSSTLLKLSQIPMPDYAPFSLNMTTECDVKRHILSITSKAIGADHLSVQMLTLILDELLSVITHIVNFSLKTSLFPSAWKKAFVIPLPKIPNPVLLEQFRPISILPILSKVLEQIVHKQFSSYLNCYKLLSPYQSGFRPSHSTITALIKVTDDIRWAMDNKLLTLLVLLDFSSAFNSVDFDILLGILSSLNVSPQTVTWFESYLRGRSQCVNCDEVSSDWCDLTAGVPQGGVLSPLLFSIFINYLTKIISSSFHLYADDLQLYKHFQHQHLDSAIACINSDLENISVWAKQHGLLVNPVKSQVIIIGSRRMRNCLDFDTIPRLTYNSVPIPYSSTVKNLGLTMDCHLSWEPHINGISKRIYYSLHSLRRLQNFLPVSTKISLVHALLLPLLDYADVCFLDATEELVNKLERLQNQCIRFIYGLRKYDRISHFRKELKMLPIRFRRNTHILCLLFNLLKNHSSPSYLRERFNYLLPRDRPLRTQTSHLLDIPSHNSGFFGDSFTVHSIRLWNALPHTVCSSQSIGIFKRRLKEYYHTLC